MPVTAAGETRLRSSTRGNGKVDLSYNEKKKGKGGVGCTKKQKNVGGGF